MEVTDKDKYTVLVLLINFHFNVALPVDLFPR